jgi:hypothetical protein
LSSTDEQHATAPIRSSFSTGISTKPSDRQPPNRNPSIEDTTNPNRYPKTQHCIDRDQRLILSDVLELSALLWALARHSEQNRELLCR